MAKIKTKRERVKFASDNVAGACPEVLDAIIKANDGDSTPYGNDQISTKLQDKFSEIFEKEVIVFPTASGIQTSFKEIAFFNLFSEHFLSPGIRHKTNSLSALVINF